MVSRLDRLSRNLHFVSGLIDQGADLIVADMPQADKRMLQVFAMVGEWERDAIAGRISAALQAKKARGEKVGNAASLSPVNNTRAGAAAEFAAKLRPTIEAFRARGLTQRSIVAELNAVGIKTAQGGDWGLIQLQRVIGRMEAATT